MTSRAKKIAAAIIVSLCLIAYYILYITVIVKINIPLALKIGLSALIIIVTVATVSVLLERIREIKKGEEDDLSKY